MGSICRPPQIRETFFNHLLDQHSILGGRRRGSHSCTLSLSRNAAKRDYVISPCRIAHTWVSWTITHNYRGDRSDFNVEGGAESSYRGDRSENSIIIQISMWREGPGAGKASHAVGKTESKQICINPFSILQQVCLQLPSMCSI